MPLVTSFKKIATTHGKTQPTEVEATYKVVTVEDGKKLFQVNTDGSKERQNPGKQSQTFQLDERSAKALWKLLGDTFGFKS